LERIAKMALLGDFYGPLLTPKQRRVWDLHYGQDFSHVEIAEAEKISRQAVYDLLKRTEKILQEYEDKLGLIRRFQDEHTKLSEVASLMQEYECSDFANEQAWERHKAISQKIDEIFQDI
jgi:predicted DNA-binding protein YlxM (UPF0122 family)